MRFFTLALLYCFRLVANATGLSSEPYISGDTWRNRVDYVLSDKETFDPRNVQMGDMIFVEQDSLNSFLQSFIPQIEASYILITANCDNGGDDPLPGRYEKILDDPNLAAWFTQNIDRIGHPKLHPIPLGLANRKYGHGNIDLYDQIISLGKESVRNKWIYLNFDVNTNPIPRRPCLEHFRRNQPRLYGMLHMEKPKPFPTYLSELSEYIFVISPPGGGIDTHRVWESLLMGCYPIVLNTTLTPLYENLPVLVVNKWEEVTPDLLKKTYEEFKNRSWKTEKLYFAFWFEQAKTIQQTLRGNRE